MSLNFDLDQGDGLASVLKNDRLRVPINQREYKWQRDNVLEMLQDINGAMNDAKPSYFFGTIVLTKFNDEEWAIADGQQRLATTTIILSAVRDLFLEMGETKRATGIEQEFLFNIDANANEEVARLRLNAADDKFFYNKIVLRPDDRPKGLVPKLESHRLILDGYQTSRNFFDGLKPQYGKRFLEVLLQWRKYLVGNAKVLVLKVQDPRNAFVMFETLNGRGIQTSQVDLIKNHLFQEAELGGREDEANKCWSAMRGKIESITDSDELIIAYIHWVCCILYGYSKEKDIFKVIEEKAKGAVNAITTLSAFDEMANDCAAIFNPEHQKWSHYPPQVRDAIKLLLNLNVKQMRPLLISIAKNFTPKQALVAYQRLISWAVRLSVVASSEAGRLDVFYANMAFEINKGEIRNYKQLFEKAGKSIPSDADFQAYFENIRLKVEKTARYYLRSLERTANDEKEAAWIPNDDATVITLEHIMPQTWEEHCGYNPEIIETHAHRLGNLALLPASVNVELDRLPFAKKAPFLKETPYRLTNMIGLEFKDWGIESIQKRQKKLAEFAPKTWPVTP